MPLYIADYLADTAHLRAAQSGAYLHLIMHYWQRGGLPDDDQQLATIAKMTDEEWRASRPIIEPLFQPGWRHKRVDEELAEAERKYQRRAAAGKKGGEAKPKPSPSNAQAMLKHASVVVVKSPPPTETVECEEGTGDTRARAREPNVSPLISPEAFALAEQFCEAIRAGPDDARRNEMAYTAQVWVARGYDRAALLAVAAGIASRWPDKPISYFAKAIERNHRERSQEPKSASDGGLLGQRREGGSNGHAARQAPRTLSLIAVESARRAAEARRDGSSG